MLVPKKTYFILITALLVTALFRYAHMVKASSFRVGLRLSEFPMSVAGWEGKGVPYPDWLPEELGANEFFIRQYSNGQGNLLSLYVAYFDARYGGTTHNPYVCYPAQGWEIVDRSHGEVEVQGNKTIRFTRIMIQKGIAKELVLFYFQMGDRTMPELSGYRLAAIVHGILFNKIGGTIVRISAPISQTVEKTYSEETEFLKTIGPMLEQYLPD